MCPDGVSLVKWLLLPDEAKPISPKHGHESAGSLDEALAKLSAIGYTDQQLAQVREYFAPSMQLAAA